MALIELSSIGQMRDELSDFEISRFFYRFARDDGDYWIQQIREAAKNDPETVNEAIITMLIHLCRPIQRRKAKLYLESYKSKKELRAIRSYMIKRGFFSFS
ncbi:hypothetical protein IJI29_02695 [Candidatus Saccharibacteria bacterium]|nr:hypothetical protein [Candidatus Saccharibacteria bacterium]